MDVTIIQDYMSKMKDIEQNIIDYLENEESDEFDHQNLMDFFKDSHIRSNKQVFKGILYMLSNISENHHRQRSFFNKIEHIFQYFIPKMKKTFSKCEIFNIFKRNKRILLFLFAQKVIIPNKYFLSIFSKDKYKRKFFSEYFLKEFKPLYDDNTFIYLKTRIPDDIDSELFEERRKEGENQLELCQMIRNDSIDEFIHFTSQSNISLSSTIRPSIYETNPIFLKNRPTLIEYAAFYGSIQIFNYLKMNNVKLNPSLWIYAIHSNNPEMIHLIEYDEIESPHYSFKDCYKESIKCHHNSIMDYIKDNLYVGEREKNIKMFLKSIQYHNYCYLYDLIYFSIANSAKFYNSDLEMGVSEEFNIFYDLCKYNYLYLVDFFLKYRNINPNMNKILNHFCF